MLLFLSYLVSWADVKCNFISVSIAKSFLYIFFGKNCINSSTASVSQNK